MVAAPAPRGAGRVNGLRATRETVPRTLQDLPTPCLVLDQLKLDRNVAAMRRHLQGLGVSFRPHLKTAKSIDVARRVMDGPLGPGIVSTLHEADYFGSHGVRDLTYGVGIAPSKLDQVGAIRARHGLDLAVILDSVEQADAVAAWSRRQGRPLAALIEIDSDGHRAGIRPDDGDQLLAIGRTLASGAELRGVLTHAGGSYALDEPGALRVSAAMERDAAAGCAAILRAAGLACPVVSMGSTPTAIHADDLAGVTEVRAGVFMFGDLVQAGIGACAIADIAISVLARVIGHQRSKGWIIVDAGWLALSRDRGTARQAVDQGYGLVCDLAGRPYGDLIVMDANQEHGILAMRPGSAGALPELPIDAPVRILPNHACATGAAHASYHVLGAGNAIVAEWPRVNGW